MGDRNARRERPGVLLDSRPLLGHAFHGRLLRRERYLCEQREQRGPAEGEQEGARLKTATNRPSPGSPSTTAQRVDSARRRSLLPYKRNDCRGSPPILSVLGKRCQHSVLLCAALDPER